MKFVSDDGKVTAAKYLKMVKDECIPELKDINVYTGTLTGMTWQQDGASVHRTRAVIEMLEKEFGGHIVALNCRHPLARIWPPRSPDLNPLDFFLWGYLKSKIFRNMPTTIDALKARIIEEVEAISPAMIKRACVDSMTKRCEKVIAANGGYVE